ncbi:MAG TPA: ABC transporter permease [Ilumatobacteraceae bacterium]|nr:ABC transporter permease [Ilumatobacteraceae bacterium]
MTITTTTISPVRAKGLWVSQTAAMSKRSIIAIVRQPALVIPSLIFPLFFAALGSSSFGRAVRLPNFPKVDNFLDFAIAGSIVQAVLFGSVTGGTALATDIEQGFFDRLLATPTSRVSILVGRLAGAAAFGGFQALFFVVVLLPFGVSIKSGVAGVVVIVLCGALTAMAIGGFTAAMALKTGSSEAVQGSFPLLFIALFFSSCFFPRQTMQGAYKTVADINPVSHLVEGLRGLVIDGFTAGHVASALLIPAAIAAVSIALAMRTLYSRLASR